MAGGHTRSSPSKGDSPVTADATGASSEPTSKAAVPSSEPAFENAPSAAGGAASPSNTTQIDGFPIEEVPNRAVEESSAEDPYQNDGAGDTLDWVIEGGEGLDGDTCRHMLAF